jgi:hypothetical protein
MTRPSVGCADDDAPAAMAAEDVQEVLLERRVVLGEPTEPERAVRVVGDERQLVIALAQLLADALVEVGEREVGVLGREAAVRKRVSPMRMTAF